MSIGSQLAWAAIGAAAKAAEQMLDTGEFGAFAERVPVKDWLGA